jgi:hypothetical protein
MITQKELYEAEEKVRSERGVLALTKDREKEFKKYFKIGLGTTAYLGLRTFVGPEMDLNIISPDIWQFLDSCAVVGSAFGGGFCGLAYGVTYLIRKRDEKDLKNAESKLAKLSKEYESK